MPENGSAATVLIIAHGFPPANTSGSKRPLRYTKYLPHYGYRVQVVSASGRLAGWENVHTIPSSETASGQARKKSQLCEVLQRRLLPYNEQLPSVPYMIEAAEKVMATAAPSIIFSTSPPLATHLAAWRIKRRHGIPWVADFRDPLYGNPFRNRRGAWLYDAALERLMLSQADAVIANTDAVAECWRKRYPKWARKIHVIWNGYDPDDPMEVMAVPERPYREICHVGSLYGGRTPAILLSSVERLIERGVWDPARTRLRFIGSIQMENTQLERPPFSTLAARGCLEYSNQWVPEREARAAMGQADYLLLLDINARSASLQIPAKLFDYIRMGRPILALTERGSPSERILNRSGVAHVCIHPDDDLVTIDSEMQRLLELPQQSLPPSQWFTECFDGRTLTGSLAAICDSLLGASNRAAVNGSRA